MTTLILLDIVEYDMIAPSSRQVALFHSPLDQQVALIKDDLLDPIDELLDDPELVALVRGKLGRRRPRSTRTGRHSIAPDRLLRCCVLKHLKTLSFRQLEREIRTNLVYRRFTHFDADVTPDHATYSRNFALQAHRADPGGGGSGERAPEAPA